MNATENIISAAATATPTAQATTGKSTTFTLVPTLISYAAFAVLVLGVIHSNGWLFALGLIVSLPMALLLFAGPLTVFLGMRNMRRHPELYETRITEDAQGNFVAIKWVKVR